MTEPRYFGIVHGGHDAGFACFDQAGELLILWQHERVSRRKRISDLENIDIHLKRAGMSPLQKSDFIFSCFGRHLAEVFLKKHFLDKPEQNPLMCSWQEVMQGYQIFNVGHHHSHAAAAWMFRDAKAEGECLFIGLDGGGFSANMGWGCFSSGIISESSFVQHDLKLNFDRYSSFARLNFIKMANSGDADVAGKLMGLAGYVPEDQLRMLRFEDIDRNKIQNRHVALGMTPEVMAELASVYVSFIQEIKDLLGRILDQHPQISTVVVGGGTFLGLELNSYISEVRGKNLVFSPGTDDSGIPLGSAALGYFLINGRWPKPIRTPFLQWGPEEKRELYLSPSKAAKALSGEGVIGLVTGLAELGPRALGHRSFLTFPTENNARLISLDIKKREYYRPVAPIVTDREFDRFFTGSKGKYMQYRNGCKSDALKFIPGAVHRDGTARCQVLSHADNPWLYELLIECGKSYGAEVLINTSLNSNGRPICNTLRDAQQEILDKRVRFVAF